MLIVLTVAAPARAADPAPVAAAPAPAPAPAAGSADTAGPTTGALSDDEVARLKKKRRTAWLATLGLVGVGGSLVIIGGGIAGGYSMGAVGTKGLWAGVGLAGVGAAVMLTAIVPGVIAARTKKRLAAHGHIVAFTPTGWAGRNGGGAGLQLRF